MEVKMKYPRISRQAQREINIPKLSGGLNLRDGLISVRDNQMTECVNMWYKNGMLRTRPSVLTSIENINMSSKNDNETIVDTRFHSEIKIVYNGLNCVCASNKRVYIDENQEVKCDIEFEFHSENRVFVMPKISNITCDDYSYTGNSIIGGESIVDKTNTIPVGKGITYFCIEMGGVLYCYISDNSIWKLEYNKNEPSNTFAPGPEWIKINNEDIYIPTTYIHCQRSGWDDFKGTFFEGYNLINNRYKMIYSAYNELDSDSTHPMRYALGNKLPESGEISVEMTSYDEKLEKTVTIEHKISYTKEEHDAFSKGIILIEKFNEGEVSEDGLYLFVKYNYVGFLFESAFTYEKGIATIDTEDRVKKYSCCEDNVVITAPYDTKEDDSRKIFAMTKSIWFGGAANGINGGSRLFLCGNKQENEKSLIVWSGLNNPLYFSENCYAYVGGNSQAVTAFGKQGENLVIFKENSIYYTCYQQNNNVSADDLISQSVIDIDANSTYFPIIQLNGYVGCDCPDTIQMCRNRLVWASSEGKVYTLCTMNQYNEHTVYELSDMIAPKLKEYKRVLKTATSADFAGHYILLLEDCAFVMDYCSYGYQYVYSYSKNEDANVLIPWYFWSFSFLGNSEYRNACICVFEGNLKLRAYFESGNQKSAFVTFTMNAMNYGDADEVFYYDSSQDLLHIKENKIKSHLRTKLFELGKGVYTVNVDGVNAKLNSNSTVEKIISFINEQGTEIVKIKDNYACTDMTSAKFIKGKVLYPNARNITKIAFDFKCDGQLCLDGLSLKYRLLGGVK